MASYTLSPIGGAGSQFFDNSGNVLSGGKLYTYAAGTTTPQTTWTTPAGTTANSNPIVFNSAGRPANEIWLSWAYSYKFVLKDSNDVLIATYDNIPGLPQPAIVNDASSISYEPNILVTAGSFVVGQTYMIASLGTTDFTAIGAGYNSPGIIFTASGAGTGTGTAYVSTTVETRLRAYEASGGSDYIGFLQSGTGALTTETVQDKLRQTVSVKDFGAVGDGVTDDTAAWDAALASGAKQIIFPSGGVYLGYFEIPSSATYEGLSIDFTGATLKGLASKNEVLVIRGGFNYARVTGSFIDMGLMTDSTSTYGFSVSHCYGGDYSNFTVINEGANSFGVIANTGVYTSEFRSIEANNFRIAGTAMGDAVTSTTFDNCDAQQFYMRYATGITIRGGALQWAGAYVKNMIDVENVRGLVVFGVDVESNTNATYISAGTNVTNVRSFCNDFVNFNGTISTGSFAPYELWDFYDPSGVNQFKAFLYGFKLDVTSPANGLLFKTYAVNNQELILQSGSQTGTGAFSGVTLKNGASATKPVNIYTTNDSGKVYIDISGGPITGLVLTTPDGTKKYAINIDNSGNLTTTLTA